MNGSEYVEDGDEAEPERGGVEVAKCKNGDWPGRVDAVMVGCKYEADAVDGAVDIVLRRNDIEELTKGELLEDIVCEDGGMLCEAEERDKFRDPNNGAEAGRGGPGNEDVGILGGFGRAKGKGCKDVLKEGDGWFSMATSFSCERQLPRVGM